MRIAVSNIAWDVVEDDQVADLLRRYRIDAVDIAPGKYFSDIVNTTRQDTARIKQQWLERGMTLTGMQALLFGTTGLNVFGTAASRAAMLDHLEHVCRIASGLGAKKLVFGSPKNRDRTGLDNAKTHAIAIDFFRRLGDVAQRWGVVICLEPNPACYGANFMISSAETLEIVKLIQHSSIQMQLDTGAITINQEDITVLLQKAAPYIGHIHISEPALAVIGDATANHAHYAHAIHRALGNTLVSIEMRASEHEPHLVALERALQCVTRTYGTVA